MSGFLEFDEGKDYTNQQGWPPVVVFLLSERGVQAGDWDPSDSLRGDLGEITGTGYERKLQPLPDSDQGLLAFAPMRWETGDANDWPAQVRSLVAASIGDPGVLLCAWDLDQQHGEPRDLSIQNHVEQLTPSYQK